MKYGLLLILLIGSIAQAQVYKSVDKNGNVIYTDVQDENAEEVIIDIAPSYTPPPIPLEVEELNEDESVPIVETPKYQLSIITPSQNESIHNPESVTVTVNISPALNEERADKLIFKLDGKQIGKAQASTTAMLTDLERGSHIVVASVVDKTGAVLKSSKSILFHIHRRSVAR